jgi:hypothetical protein
MTLRTHIRNWDWLKEENIYRSGGVAMAQVSTADCCWVLLPRVYVLVLSLWLLWTAQVWRCAHCQSKPETTLGTCSWTNPARWGGGGGSVWGRGGVCVYFVDGGRCGVARPCQRSGPRGVSATPLLALCVRAHVDRRTRLWST